MNRRTMLALGALAPVVPKDLMAAPEVAAVETVRLPIVITKLPEGKWHITVGNMSTYVIPGHFLQVKP